MKFHTIHLVKMGLKNVEEYNTNPKLGMEWILKSQVKKH